MGFGAILGFGLAGLFAWCATASFRERRGGGLPRELGQHQGADGGRSGRLGILPADPRVESLHFRLRQRRRGIDVAGVFDS